MAVDKEETPLFLSSPERIGLAISDNEESWHSEFPGAHDANATWYSGEDPLRVCVHYVRADLYESLQSQLAAANERADAAVKALEDARRQVQFPRQPNGEGGWIIDANYISAIRKDCPVEWQPGEEEIEAVLLAAERAAPVPAQPAVVLEVTADDCPRRHNLSQPERHIWALGWNAARHAILSTTDTEVKNGPA